MRVRCEHPSYPQGSNLQGAAAGKLPSGVDKKNSMRTLGGRPDERFGYCYTHAIT